MRTTTGILTALRDTTTYTAEEVEHVRLTITDGVESAFDLTTTFKDLMALAGPLAEVDQNTLANLLVVDAQGATINPLRAVADAIEELANAADTIASVQGLLDRYHSAAALFEDHSGNWLDDTLVRGEHIAAEAEMGDTASELLKVIGRLEELGVDLW
jgi:hypothetical protein